MGKSGIISKVKGETLEREKNHPIIPESIRSNYFQQFVPFLFHYRVRKTLDIQSDEWLSIRFSDVCMPALIYNAYTIQLINLMFAVVSVSNHCEDIIWVID